MRVINRRNFLKSSTAVSGVLLGLPGISRSADNRSERSGPRPRHIIHLVADGTSPCTLTCGDYLSRLRRQRELTWLSLYRKPAAHFGLMNMRSLNSYVTDSSAASSSWGSGSRIKNGAVNQLPDKTPLKTIYELLAEAGWKRGLVTTTEITHATPAGFATSVATRDAASTIAAQYLERQVDVLLGGGQKFFAPGTRKDKRDLYADYARAGYAVMKHGAELRQASLTPRWLGTFALSHLPFTLDRAADPALQERVPTLATLTRRALDWLQRHDHFMLQVEGGRVDHAAHNNDAAAALHELIAFDEALDVVLAFQQQVPDTLVVVTTDHGTGGLALNGMGSGYGDSVKLFKNLQQVRCSFPEILRRIRHESVEKTALEEGVINDARDEDEKVDAPDKAEEKTAAKGQVPTAQDVVEHLLATTGYKVSERRAGLLLPYLAKKGDPLFKAMNSDVAALGQLLGNHLGIGWTGTAHTADFVPILALGPGAERFHGFIQNVDVFQHYTQLAGIDFQNPKGEEVAATDAAPAALENSAEYAIVQV